MKNYYSFSDDNSLNEDGEKECSMSDNMNAQSSNNKKQENHINEIINEESFEDAFNNIFSIKEKNNEIWGVEDDPLPPVFEYNLGGNKLFKPFPEKEKFILQREDENSKSYPFTKGVGLSKALEKIGLAANCNSFSKVTISNQSLNSRFRITDYYTDEKGKKKKIKKKRKFKPDDIRKKIKARFHKALKNIINTKLKKVGSKKLFELFPQNFITNITIKLNNQAFDLTFEELIKKDYFSEDKAKKKKTDIDKFTKNLGVLNYLEENPEICKKSEFEKIKNMKYIELLNAYFLSMEFEDSIKDLNDKNEKIDYIEAYLNKALTYVPFFSYSNKRFNDTKNFKESEYNNIIKIAYNDENEVEEEDDGYKCD